MDQEKGLPTPIQKSAYHPGLIPRTSAQNHECVTGGRAWHVTQMTHHFCPASESRICKSGY
jgi:hypothetical protein